MQISEQGLDLIKQFEGCKLAAYQDQAGVWTLGYGHTAGVSEGDTCTADQADAWLRQDVVHAQESVTHMVTAPLNQNQFDALVSFTFNLGPGSLKMSTLLKKLNAQDYDGAAAEFPKWDHVAGREDDGVLRRRNAEAAMFQA